MIGIHQPEHAPWIGLLDKIRQCQVFVILDNVQFKKNDFQNRNKLRSGWATVPVASHPLDTDIADIRIANVPWTSQYLARYRDYANEQHYRDHYAAVEYMIEHAGVNLANLNLMILAYLMKAFGIKTPLIRASSLGLPKIVGGNEVVLQICKHFRSTEYLSGTGGRNYLKLPDFEREGITVQFNEPAYPHLSAFDHLFIHGPTF